MLSVMRNKAWFKDVIGVMAAYVFVLQVLLTSVVATQMALAGVSANPAFCYGNGAPASEQDRGAPHQAHHGPCLVCSFASLTPPVPDRIVISVATLLSDAALIATHTNERRSEFPQTPRLSQGPPHIV